MGKLKEYWDLYKSLDPSDPRRRELQKKINDTEKWCIAQGYEGFKVTKFNDNEFAVSKNYPHKSGAVYFDDFEKLQKVLDEDKI